ncbi:MAG: hypothetical protein ACR2QO_22575 [Acidimicrobiales bacterium]
MTDPSVQVDLEQGIVEVGGIFRGRLQRRGEVDDLASGSNQQVRAVRLTLGYETEGRGDVDKQTVAEQRFPVDEYGRVDASFGLAVPSNGPISYDGRLIRVLWSIQARVDVKLAMDRTTDIPVLIIPSGGWGLYHQPHPLPR